MEILGTLLVALIAASCSASWWQIASANKRNNSAQDELIAENKRLRALCEQAEAALDKQEAHAQVRHAGKVIPWPQRTTA
jgi:hypothetical protein